MPYCIDEDTKRDYRRLSKVSKFEQADSIFNIRQLDSRLCALHYSALLNRK